MVGFGQEIHLQPPDRVDGNRAPGTVPTGEDLTRIDRPRVRRARAPIMGRSMHDIRPCNSTPCHAFWPGHQMHPIHAGAVGRTPEGWRDGLITAIDGGMVTVAYLHEVASAVIWHHRDFRGSVRLGEPVAVHEGYHALQIGRRLLNAAIISGAGGTPTVPALGRPERQLFVVDLENGEGEPLEAE